MGYIYVRKLIVKYGYIFTFALSTERKKNKKFHKVTRITVKLQPDLKTFE